MLTPRTTVRPFALTMRLAANMTGGHIAILAILSFVFLFTGLFGQAMAGIGVGIAIALAYWTTILFFAAMGSGGLLAPMLAAWAPNLLFGAGAAYLLLTVRT